MLGLSLGAEEIWNDYMILFLALVNVYDFIFPRYYQFRLNSEDLKSA